MKQLLSAALFSLAAFALVSAQDSGFHNFTNKQGKVMTARIDSVDLDWKTMTITRRDDQKQYRISPNVLTLDGQQYVKNWLKDKGILEPKTPDPNDPSPPNIPVMEDSPPAPAIDLDAIRLEVRMSRKNHSSDSREYSSYMDLETKRYTFDITIKNGARQTIPTPIVSYAVVWEEEVELTTSSYYTRLEDDDFFAIKGEETLDDLVYNRDQVIRTEPVEINRVVEDGNNVYREDDLLGVVVRLTLKDGTEIGQFRSTDAENAKLTWDIVSKFPSDPGSSSVVSSPITNDDQINLRLRKGESQDGPIPLANKRITITAKVSPDTSEPNGVVVAIGGDDTGLSLFVKDRQIYGCVANKGDFKLVSKSLPLGKFGVKLELDKNGLSLSIDSGSAAVLSEAGLFTTFASDGIDVGEDKGKLAGRYPADFKFAGSIEDLRISIRE